MLNILNESAEVPPIDAVVGYRLFREGAIAPSRGTEHAAGYDLHAWAGPDFSTASYIIAPGDMQMIKTGLNLRIPAGYEVQIRPRSGLAAKKQITVMNSPGTIDADYDGDGEGFEIVVMLKNTGTQEFVVTHGMRIAQMVVKQVPNVKLEEVFGDNNNRLHSSRYGGLGSTGLNSK